MFAEAVTSSTRKGASLVLVVECEDWLGLRRDLLALRPIALTVLALLVAVDVAAAILGADLKLVIALATVHVLFTLSWLITVRARWVHEQAVSYAERLFETLEEPTLSTPSESQ